MAITDNLVIRIKAEAEQTAITDNIAGLSVNTGAGTVTLMEDPTYGLFWRLTGGLKSAVLSGMGEWMNAQSTTVAMRFRVSNRADNYSRFMIMGSDTDSGLMIGNGGTSTGGLRVGVQVGGSTIGSVAPPTYTTGDMMTAVIRFVEGATDAYSGWYKTVDRVGTDPNYSATSTTNSAYRARALLQFLTASENLDIFDYAMLARGVTNAEGAALADDIRTTLYGGATNATGSGSVASITLTAPSGTGTGTSVGAGTITTPVLKNNTGLVLANETSITVNVYNATTGALIVQKTGQTSNPSGIVTVSDALIVAGTTYAYEVILTSSRRRLPLAVAA